MITELNREKLLGHLKENRENILHPEVTKYYDKLVRINRKGGAKRGVFIYPKFGQEREDISRHFLSIFSSLQKLVKYITFDEPGLLKLLKLPDVDIEGLKKRPTETLINYCRIDGVRSNDTFKFFEINTRKPQMFEDSDWLSRFIVQNYNLPNTQVEDTAANIAELIDDSYFINTKRRPQTILFIPNELKPQYSFSLYIQMVKRFHNSSLIISSVQELYDGVFLKNKELYFKNLKVDLIVTQGKNLISGKNSFYTTLGQIRNNHIREAFHYSNLEIFTSPASIFSGSKLLLSLLQEEEIQRKINLTSEEIEVLRISLPHSYKWNNIKIKNIDKDSYVIKKGRGMGLGIYLGNSMTQEAWDNLLNYLISNKKRFVLQERINFQTDEILDLKTLKFTKAYTTLEPIIINNPIKQSIPFISGYSSRGILEKYYIESMKFNPATNRSEILYGNYLEGE